VLTILCRDCFVPHNDDLPFSCQQKSFGRNRGEQCKTCAVAGHSKCLQKHRPRMCEAGQIFTAQVLPDLQGKGPVRQRSLSADLIFGSLYQDKEQSLSGKRHQAINKRPTILNHPISQPVVARNEAISKADIHGDKCFLMPKCFLLFSSPKTIWC
jgi:hypothetical protein